MEMLPQFFYFAATNQLMKKLLSLLLIIPTVIYAQSEKEGTKFVQNQHTVDIGFTGLQLGSELTIGKTSTIQFRTGIAPLFYNASDNLFADDVNKVVAAWMVTVEPKLYYNFPKRLEKGKDINNNGANYVGFIIGYFSKPLGKNKDLFNAASGIFAGPMWGFNRSIAKPIYFLFSLGPIIQHESGENRNLTAISLYGDARFCIRFAGGK